jgi:serine O-acetyltransferase
MVKKVQADPEAATGAHPDECRLDYQPQDLHYQQIPAVVSELVNSCYGQDCFEHVSTMPLPSREAVVDLIYQGRDVLFPGYFTTKGIDPVNLPYILGQKVTGFYQSLAKEITSAIRHDCHRYEQDCKHCVDNGRELGLSFIKKLPELRAMLALDVRAAYEGDPASASLDEIIFSYPGLFAITVHRMAHVLYHLKVPLIPRMLSEHAHSLTGIDIHPGAHMGQSFFIDHGTGVVIGETTKIGDRVRIYQGVTLGALSVSPDQMAQLRTEKRHPTIEDDVIIYSGATILGGATVIGERSVIGGNVWLTQSVPPDTKVFIKNPELIYRGKSGPLQMEPGKKRA